MQSTHRSRARISLRAIACIALVPLALCAGTEKEQYLVLNIIPGEDYRSTFQEIRHLIPVKTSSHVRLGVGAIFSYLDESRARCKAQLLEFLSLAEEYGMPIVVQLDGEQWWRARPDLWNWWDPCRPGYTPQNRLNVEWTGWGPAHAVKIAWRNWGRQIRVLPPPNFMSPRYREACHAEMQILIPLILQWWERLPDEKKFLLIGIKLGWESAIGVNSFCYPNGNALLDCPEREDPQQEVKGEQVPDRGFAPIGYAAIMTARFADTGIVQEAHLAEVVRRHLDDLCALASALGVPREKLFTHIGGWKDEELLYDTALNRYCCPGWSFYRYASDPANDPGVQRVLQKNDAPFWAAVEWMLMDTKDLESWRSALHCTLSIPKCRYLCIYNWSGIKDNPGAIGAVIEMLEPD